MAEVGETILRWGVPALVVFAVTAIAIAVLVWAVRAARRSPRARAAAQAARIEAGAALVRLDDEVDELDLEVGLSGALYGGNAPTSMRRARMTAQHLRDAAFEDYRAASAPDASPVDVRKISARIQKSANDALATISRARAEHTEWMRANVSAIDQVSAAQSRLQALRASMGDPAALVADLSSRFAEEEWREASRAASAAVSEAEDARAHLAAAAAQASDPTRSPLAELAAAERSLRRAENDARILEESHRLVTQAAQAVPGEFEAARGALRQAMTTRESLPTAEGERLAHEIRAVDAELTALERDAARRPTRTIDRIARLRDRLDLALGDARSAQQRVRGARTALPGTIAAARNAIAHAEASVAHSSVGADARVRLISAQRELAAARQATDPVAALDAARRAMRDAEDATSLAEYARVTGR